jgi:hypothetical protein
MMKNLCSAQANLEVYEARSESGAEVISSTFLFHHTVMDTHATRII